jgi:hypothetical protein
MPLGDRNGQLLNNAQTAQRGGLAEREKERRTHGKSKTLLTGDGLLMEGLSIFDCRHGVVSRCQLHVP